jgi:hypothetical protein
LALSISGTVTQYHIPFGNYSATSFVTAVQSLLAGTWTVSLDRQTAMFTLANSASEFIVKYDASTIGRVMGFNVDVYSSSRVAVMPLVANFNQFSRVNFRCRELSNSCQIQSGQHCTGDIFLSVPNSAPILGNIVYHGGGAISSVIDLGRFADLKQIAVAITDDDDNLINFNGGICTFTLQFDIYRRILPRTTLPISELVNNMNRK